MNFSANLRLSGANATILWNCNTHVYVLGCLMGGDAQPNPKEIITNRARAFSSIRVFLLFAANKCGVASGSEQ